MPFGVEASQDGHVGEKEVGYSLGERGSADREYDKVLSRSVNCAALSIGDFWRCHVYILKSVSLWTWNRKHLAHLYP